MTLTLELTPEQEERLKEARAQGIDVESVFQGALTQTLDYLESVADLKVGIADMEAGNRVTMEQARADVAEAIEWARLLPREEFLARLKAKYGVPR